MMTFQTAKVLERNNAAYVEVVFLESARFYKLLKLNKHYTDYLELLKESEKKQQPVRVKLTTPHGDIIDKVERISSK